MGDDIVPVFSDGPQAKDSPHAALQLAVPDGWFNPGMQDMTRSGERKAPSSTALRRATKGGVADGAGTNDHATHGQTESDRLLAWYGGWRSTQLGGIRDVDAVQQSGGMAVDPGEPVRVGPLAFPGSSGPVGAYGTPAVLYHGTRDNVGVFKLGHQNQRDPGWLGRGIYFTTDPWVAEQYARLKTGGGSQVVMPAYVAVKRPYVADAGLKARLKAAGPAGSIEFTRRLREAGYDGVVVNYGDVVELVALDSTQVKSAIGNSGSFDAGNPNITRSTPRDVANGSATQDEREAASILQGAPVARLFASDAPSAGYAAIESWASDLFARQGGKAVRSDIGEVMLDRRAAKTSLAHGGANRYKKIAFAAIKDVIERGALVAAERAAQEDSFFISAPVDIDGVDNIVTALIHRDPNTQRVYLHSVTTKENLLNQRVSSADAEASGRSGSSSSGGINSVLRRLLSLKLSDGGGVSRSAAREGVVHVERDEVRQPGLPDAGQARRHEARRRGDPRTGPGTERRPGRLPARGAVPRLRRGAHRGSRARRALGIEVPQHGSHVGG